MGVLQTPSLAELVGPASRAVGGYMQVDFVTKSICDINSNTKKVCFLLCSLFVAYSSDGK